MLGGSADLASCAQYIKGLNDIGTCTTGNFMQYQYDGDCRCCAEGSPIGDNQSVNVYKLNGPSPPALVEEAVYTQT